MMIDKILIILKNNAKKLVKFSFLSLFLILVFPFVAFAKNVDEYTSAYGYYYFDSNNTKHTVNWTGYSSSNNIRYNYELPAEYIFVNDFGIRFRINGGFKAGTNYILTFTWTNYSPDVNLTGTWYDNYILMPKEWTCRETSWSSTSLPESTCFEADNYSEKVEGSNPDSDVVITLHFTPKIDMYGLTIYWYHNNNGYYEADGWELHNFSYEEVTDNSQAIIDNATQNTQNIINNQNTNTQNIINNQNQNTQAIIDSNTSCQYYDGNSTVEDGYLNQDGVIGNTASSYGVTSYIPVNRDTKINVVVPIIQGLRQCYYNINKVFLSCVTSANSDNTLTIPAGASYVRFSINRAQNKPQFQICKNGSQAVVDAITDNTPPDSSPIANATGWLPPGPVDSILNLPLTLMNSISNVISSGVCQPITIDLPHISNNPLVLPCMSTVWSNIGLGTFFTWFGRILGGIILYKYLVRLYKWVDDTLTMRENNNFDDGSMG